MKLPIFLYFVGHLFVLNTVASESDSTVKSEINLRVAGSILIDNQPKSETFIRLNYSLGIAYYHKLNSVFEVGACANWRQYFYYNAVSLVDFGAIMSLQVNQTNDIEARVSIPLLYWRRNRTYTYYSETESTVQSPYNSSLIFEASWVHTKNRWKFYTGLGCQINNYKEYNFPYDTGINLNVLAPSLSLGVGLIIQ